MVPLQSFDEEILISYHGKFDEIFELPHIIRIICDLDRYSKNSKHQYFETIDSNLVIQE